MSKAFTKEAGEAPTSDPLPDRPVPAGSNLVTAEGLAQIDQTITRLQRERDTARDSSNISEVAGFARELRYWTARRASAQVIEPSGSSEVVEFGSTVTIQHDDGRKHTYRIVGTDEADPAHGTLSDLSPLARALIGKAVGERTRIGGTAARIIALR